MANTGPLARSCAQGFSWFVALNPHGSPEKCIFLLCHLDWWGNWGTEYLNHFPKVTVSVWWSQDLSGSLMLPFSAGEESACNSGDTSSIPGLGRSPGGGSIYFKKLRGKEAMNICCPPTICQALCSVFYICYIMFYPPKAQWESLFYF